jgi:hypothetical protein
MVRFSDSLGNITVFYFCFQAQQDQIPFSAQSILKKYRENVWMIAGLKSLDCKHFKSSSKPAACSFRLNDRRQEPGSLGGMGGLLSLGFFTWRQGATGR